MRWRKDNLQIFTLKKMLNVLRQLLFLEIVSVTKVKNKLFRCMCIKWYGGGRTNERNFCSVAQMFSCFQISSSYFLLSSCFSRFFFSVCFCLFYSSASLIPVLYCFLFCFHVIIFSCSLFIPVSSFLFTVLFYFLFSWFLDDSEP